MRFQRPNVGLIASSFREALETAIEDERRIDDLTSLPNERALDAELLSLAESKEPFWAAFVEIDRFKAINDEFGYEPANGMIKAVARELYTAESRFANGATAFRAHGDEFYILGKIRQASAGDEGRVIDTNDADVSSALEAIKDCIKSVRLHVANAANHMKCQVSIGWLMSSELSGTNVKAIKKSLEAAVDKAKRDGRDRVVRFDGSIAKPRTFNQRDTCAECKSSFSVDIPTENNREGQSLLCPNCGKELPRTPVPNPPPEERRV